MEVNHDEILFGVCMVLVAMFAILIIINPVGAYPYVEQGSTITQGETYDLEGVYGWTGKLAWWGKWYDEGGTNNPAVIVDLNDYKTYAVYIDPDLFQVGNWYQWDGMSQSEHANNFVFRVNASSKPIIKLNKTTPTIPNLKQDQIIIPTPVPVVITLPTSIPTPKTTALIIVPTVTMPKTPTNPLLVVVGVVCAVLLFLWFREKR
jgi:hypothetical protein